LFFFKDVIRIIIENRQGLRREYCDIELKTLSNDTFQHVTM